MAVEGPLVFDDEEMVLNAALAGLGLAFLIEDHVTPLVKSGALTRVLDDWCPPFPGFFLYYPGRRQASPALAAFIDAVRVPVKTIPLPAAGRAPTRSSASKHLPLAVRRGIRAAGAT